MMNPRSALKRRRLVIAVVAAAMVVLLSGVVAVAADGSGDAGAPRTASSDPAPNPDIAKEIYGSGRAYVGDGNGGVAGWIDPMQLGANGDVKVYSDDGTHIGYWVDNLGFVDRETHDSPSYDPNAIRIARFGADVVQSWERDKAELDQCLDTHTVEFCQNANQ